MTDAESPPSELQHRFLIALNDAITRGGAPGHDTGLGRQTLAAMTLVAHNHPDATAALIADAYDAFNSEHR
ncbi:hypothetical protein [Mycolicibacterium porcinum]|uniref:TetR family transcriptional regulator n=1 Tax=Mycolicibacterium porcinum TaxID=39693 RepID=A0ABV3VN46_9MYCO